jgi:ribosomal subunit interface protein
MQVPVQISFHGIDHSDAVEQRVKEKVAKLENYCSDITSCRVVIEVDHKNRSGDYQKGQPYHVHIDVSVPGDDLVVKRAPNAHEDVYIAIRDAFQSMERQVKDYMERKRQPARRAG